MVSQVPKLVSHLVSHFPAQSVLHSVSQPVSHKGLSLVHFDLQEPSLAKHAVLQEVSHTPSQVAASQDVVQVLLHSQAASQVGGSVVVEGDAVDTVVAFVGGGGVDD